MPDEEGTEEHVQHVFREADSRKKNFNRRKRKKKSRLNHKTEKKPCIQKLWGEGGKGKAHHVSQKKRDSASQGGKNAVLGKEKGEVLWSCAATSDSKTDGQTLSKTQQKRRKGLRTTRLLRKGGPTPADGGRGKSGLPKKGRTPAHHRVEGSRGELHRQRSPLPGEDSPFLWKKNKCQRYLENLPERGPPRLKHLPPKRESFLRKGKSRISRSYETYQEEPEGKGPGGKGGERQQARCRH